MCAVVPPACSVWGSHGAGVTNWTFLLKKSESAYLILIMTTVLLLPLLELLGHLPINCGKPRHQAALPTAADMPTPVKSSTSALATNVNKRTSSPATRGSSWVKSCMALVWPFPRLSTTAAIFVALFVVFTLLTIIVPLATLATADLKAPMFISPYQEVSSTDCTLQKHRACGLTLLSVTILILQCDWVVHGQRHRHCGRF